MFIWSLILTPFILGIDPQQLNEKEIVTVTVDPTFVKPGRQGWVNIQVKIKEGYHIQANAITDESLIPATLKIQQNKSFKIDKPVFPPNKLFRLEGSENYLYVFDSVFTIRLPVKTSTGTKKGRYQVRAELRYQACNARTCLFPRTVEFNLPIIVIDK